MSDMTLKLNEESRADAAQKNREEEFDKAVERVCQKYGSDLTAFVNDFRRQAMLKQQEPEE